MCQILEVRSNDRQFLATMDNQQPFDFNYKIMNALSEVAERDKFQRYNLAISTPMAKG